jgi:anaerobic selenocysteine-containing dehydrogenase
VCAHELKNVRTCCDGCLATCGIIAEVDNGKVLRVKGDAKHPESKGHVCLKGLSSIETLYNENRINFPLKRMEKGNKWKRISWDEALSHISSKLNKIKNKYGPESIVIANGSWAYDNVGISNFFSAALETPNVMGMNYLCFGPMVTACYINTGIATSLSFSMSREWADSNCLIMWASNPSASEPNLTRPITKAKQDGMKLIVIDPRQTYWAKKADLWLQIRPGTDDALALAMLNVIIKEELYDKKFVNEWCLGFEELKDRVKKYTPEKVSKITWISEEKIIEAARIYAKNKPASIFVCTPLDMCTNSVQTERLVVFLIAICGNLDTKGGVKLPLDTPVKGITDSWFEGLDKLPRHVRERRIGAKELPLYSGPDASLAMAHPNLVMKAIQTGEPYPVKAMINTATNPVMTHQDSEQVWNSLKKLDFMVTIDCFMTPTAELSDIVLPATGYLERNGMPYHYPNCVSICHKAVEPLFERWSDKKIFIELAKRMNLKLPWKSEKEYNNYRLSPSHITFEELKEKNMNYVEMPKKYEKYKKEGFLTPSKKFEFYSNFLKTHGFDPLPDYKPPAQTTAEYPLIWLTGPRKMEYNHSTGRQIKMLRSIHPEPEIEIHPETAKRLQIEDGNKVYIETQYGNGKRIWMKAKLTNAIHPKMVCSQHGWWYPEKPGPMHGCFESNTNYLLTSEEYDPIGGSTHTRDIPCQIYKANDH